MDNFEKTKNMLRGQKQNKGKSEEELDLLTKEKIEKDEILGSLTFCLETEREFASNLLGKYLAESAIESFTDRDTLRQLIDLEIIVERIKALLNIEYDKANKAIPLQMLDQLTSLNSQVMDLKERLGLTQKKEDKNDTVKVIEDLKERFHKWINKPDNRSNYECQCPGCGEIILIRRRLDKITDEVLEHPWFRDDGVLFNRQIFVDLELSKISIDQAARYLNVSQDYILWIKKTYPLNEDKQEETEDEE